MKFQIKHDCRGRIRVQAVQQRMTLEQADMLEAWLLTLPQVECASVHERTRCAVIEYQGDRKDLLRILAGFSYQDHALAELVPVHSSRALNRAYEEKLVGMVAFKAVRSLFFPAPLRAVYTVIRSAPYLFRALRCLLRRQLHVELLDGISVCLSMVRRDFDTASSVMFLLRLGELLEEWTHKKSVENLARSMSLNIDRVWMKTESGEELVPLHQVQAGDQVVIRMGGAQCTCGRKGCFEAYASATALIRQTREAMEKHPESKLWDLCGGDLEKVEGKTAFDGQALGDETAKRIVSRYVKYLAEGLVNICNEFRPEAIVLGGGVCGAGDVLLKPLKRRINRYIYGGTKYAPVKVVIASLGNDAGLVGAVKYAIDCVSAR